MIWKDSDFPGMERFFRAHLINSVTGFKSLCLLGTVSTEDMPNLAVFTQVFHIGADPALLGVLFRPQIQGMHSLANIRSTRWFTLNHVLAGEAEAAHWTSARWEIPEFEAVGLEPEFIDGIPAPFVKGNRVRMALQAVQELDIELNGTTLVVARIHWLEVPDKSLQDDGFADLMLAGSLAGTGLDGYAEIKEFRRFSYARTREKPASI